MRLYAVYPEAYGSERCPRHKYFLHYTTVDHIDWLALVIVNNGTCPAEDVEIHMHFPDWFMLRKKKLTEPIAPEPPVKPKTFVERVAESLRMPGLFGTMQNFDRLQNAQLPEHRNVSTPTIRRTKSFDVSVTAKRIKHGFQECLDPLFVVFEATGEPQSFPIKYQIHAANLVDAAEGMLHAVIKR